MNVNKTAQFPINAVVGGTFFLVSASPPVQHAGLDVGVWLALGLSFLVIGIGTLATVQANKATEDQGDGDAIQRDQRPTEVEDADGGDGLNQTA